MVKYYFAVVDIEPRRNVSLQIASSDLEWLVLTVHFVAMDDRIYGWYFITRLSIRDVRFSFYRLIYLDYNITSHSIVTFWKQSSFSEINNGNNESKHICIFFLSHRWLSRFRMRKISASAFLKAYQITNYILDRRSRLHWTWIEITFFVIVVTGIFIVPRTSYYVTLRRRLRSARKF